MPGVQNPHWRPCSAQKASCNGMKLAVGREPFDRRDLGAVGLNGQDGTALRAAAVEHDRAGAALAGVAPHVRAGQVQLFAQEVDQKRPRFDFSSADSAVNRE